MKQLIVFLCLISTSGFAEEALQLSQKEISISILNNEQLVEASPKELFSESKTITLQAASKDDAHKEIVYPIEESNFKEVFGGNP